MADFSKGVSYYTWLNLPTPFPEDEVCCYWCPEVSTDHHLARQYCRRTGEIIPAPKYMVGRACPLEGARDEKI